ncbi:hypothetical protein HZ326_1068 [Fusarium oxysporum f. sp. albedinis]|nr:hypothetical protein HZ326_1068 [Fusarium oxysporum f. sp. albedinis]
MYQLTTQVNRRGQKTSFMGPFVKPHIREKKMVEFILICCDFGLLLKMISCSCEQGLSQGCLTQRLGTGRRRRPCIPLQIRFRGQRVGDSRARSLREAAILPPALSLHHLCRAVV